MPLGLCNAPATFQQGMIVIFVDMVEDKIEVFMDDFSVFGYPFDHFLHILSLVLERCKERNLVLNWEKCHFMVQEGIFLGHHVSKDGFEVDTTKVYTAKVYTIETLVPPTIVRGVRSFLKHAGFYGRFIKYFSKIVRPLCMLLEKDTVFSFDKACIEAFNEIMCDASDNAIRAVVGQSHDKIFRATTMLVGH